MSPTLPHNPAVLRLGTRGSRLALTQTQHVAEVLRRAHPHLTIEPVVIQTTGDKILDSALSRIGGKGVFTKEIEEALLDGRVDLAVHSLKDLPVRQPKGLMLGAISKREDPSDMLIAAEPVDLRKLGAGSAVGTSSLRRRAQIRLINPNVEVRELRGNVPTRIQKAVDGQYAAVILASAGVRRLGLTPPFMQALRFDDFLPAPGQGALGIQIREGDDLTRLLLAPLDDAISTACCTAERALLEGLGGGCQLPLGALAEVLIDGRLRLRGRVADPLGNGVCEGEVIGDARDAEKLGYDLSERLLARGAAEILRRVIGGNDSLAGFHEAVARAQAMNDRPLGGRRVLITRDEDADGPLSLALRALGAEPLCLPVVHHEPPADPAPLRAAVLHAATFDWLVFTSARAVDAFAGAPGASLANCRVAVVGTSTAHAVEKAGGKVALQPAEAHAAALGSELLAAGVGPGTRVLFVRAEGARRELPDMLTAAGAELTEVVGYRTAALKASEPLREAMALRRPDAVLFCSPSAVEAFAAAVAPLSPAAFLAGVMVGSIGPTTSEALKAAEMPVAVEATDRTFEGLARALAEHMADLPKG